MNKLVAVEYMSLDGVIQAQRGRDRTGAEHQAQVRRLKDAQRGGLGWDGILRDGFPAEIERLKRESGKPILMAGSPDLAQTLIEHDLIDEYQRWLRRSRAIGVRLLEKPPKTNETMEPTKILPIVVVLSLVTVEYGGWALLTFLSGREGIADWQKGFFRAGHAHAGVLLVLSLVYLLYLPRADFSDALEWAAGGVLLAGVLAQSGGFFLHLAIGRPGEPSAGTKLTRAGAALIAAALLTLAVGLIKTV